MPHVKGRQGMEEQGGRRKRSGTETRQKQQRVTFRVNAAELAELDEQADAAGVTIGTYVRSRALAKPETRGRHRPSVERVTLARILAELNHIGGNIHGLLKDVRFGGTPAAEDVRAAFAGYREMHAAVIATLEGRKL